MVWKLNLDDEEEGEKVTLLKTFSGHTQPVFFFSFLFFKKNIQFSEKKKKKKMNSQ